jgi:hypothetical protein
MLARTTEGGAVACAPRRTEEAFLLRRDIDPDAIADEVLSLLGRERYRSARRLASQALARFPDHIRVRGVWGIFDNRGKAKISPLGPQVSTDEEFEWLKHPPPWAAGKWVALVGPKAVASADTLAELEKAVDSMDLPKLPLAIRIDDR